MGTMKKIGGDTVAGGTFWNMRTGEKVRMEIGGTLPGSDEDVYYRAPRWLLLSLIPIAAMLIVDVVPNAVKFVYEQYSDTLVFSYAVIIFSFMGVVLALIGAGLVWDIMSLRELTVFGWRPGEAYLAGRGKKKAGKK